MNLIWIVGCRDVKAEKIRHAVLAKWRFNHEDLRHYVVSTLILLESLTILYGENIIKGSRTLNTENYKGAHSNQVER